MDDIRSDGDPDEHYVECLLYLLEQGVCIIKEIKGDVKDRPQEDTEKIRAPDGIRTHDHPCSRSDALTSGLLRIRWRARCLMMRKKKEF